MVSKSILQRRPISHLYNHWIECSNLSCYFEKKTMLDPSVLGMTLILATNDALPILPRFQLLYWLENHGLCSLDSKHVWQHSFNPKHPRNHDKPIHVLKKTQKTAPKTELNPKQKINSNLDLFFQELLSYTNT